MSPVLPPYLAQGFHKLSLRLVTTFDTILGKQMNTRLGTIHCTQLVTSLITNLGTIQGTRFGTLLGTTRQGTILCLLDGTRVGSRFGTTHVTKFGNRAYWSADLAPYLAPALAKYMTKCIKKGMAQDLATNMEPDLTQALKYIEHAYLNSFLSQR